MNDWVQLRHVMACLDGRRIPLNREERSEMQGEIPYWGAGGVVDWVDRALFHETLVLLGEDGAPFFEAGRDVAFLVDGPVWVNNHIHVLRPIDIDPRFLMYSLNVTDFGRYITGSTRDKLTQDGMKTIEIWRPPLAEQRRIADFLDIEMSRIGALASARCRMRGLLELRRERTIESVLGLTNGESTKVGTVPLSYSARDVVVGIVVTPAAWYVEVEGVPALRGLNVRPGRIDTSDLVLIGAEGDALHRKSRLRAGDVVVVRTGQAGAAAVVTDKHVGFNCIDLVIVRTGPHLDPNYLSYFLNSDHTRNRVSEYAVGSIQSHFNVGAMKRVPVPAIPVDEQRKVVKQLDEEINRVDRLLGRLALQERVLVERREALITAAVTGQIDVTTARGAEL